MLKAAHTQKKNMLLSVQSSTLRAQGHFGMFVVHLLSEGTVTAGLYLASHQPFALLMDRNPPAVY